MKRNDQHARGTSKVPLDWSQTFCVIAMVSFNHHVWCLPSCEQTIKWRTEDCLYLINELHCPFLWIQYLSRVRNLSTVIMHPILLNGSSTLVTAAILRLPEAQNATANANFLPYYSSEQLFGVLTLTTVWRLAIILLLLGNLKNLPFMWTVR